MTDPRYFINFAPAAAVQYDGTNRAEVTRIAGYFSYGIIDGDLVLTRKQAPSIFVKEGQWLVRQGDKVWVQDEEPARVVRWETGRMSPGGDVWDHDWLSWWPEYRRPVLSNGWTGPWVPVAGGAE